MYMDLDSYAAYIAAYKTFMVETAKVLVREMGTAVTEETLMAKADEIFEFERQIFQHSYNILISIFSSSRKSIKTSNANA